MLGSSIFLAQFTVTQRRAPWRATSRVAHVPKLSASRPVSRVLYGLKLAPQTWRPFILGTRCRAPHATYPDTHSRNGLPRFPLARCPYSVLLPAGLAMPLALPLARWALTPPFHPYRAMAPKGDNGRFNLCGAIPGVAPAGH
jgi:hypothetical protein